MLTRHKIQSAEFLEKNYDKVSSLYSLKWFAVPVKGLDNFLPQKEKQVYKGL